MGTSTLEITTNSVLEAAGNINLNAVGDLVASANSTLRGAVVTLTSNASVLLQDVAEITATAELSVRAALNATVQVQQLVANGVSIVADEFAEIQSNIDSINVNDTLNSIDISGVQGVIVEADRVLRGDLINIISSEGEVLLNDGVSLDAVESIVLESVQDLNLDNVTLVSSTVRLNSTANILVSASNITAQVELILQAGADATLNAGTLINIESLTADVQGALDLGNNLLLNVTNDVNLLVNELVLGDGAVIRSVTGDILANVTSTLEITTNSVFDAAGNINLNAVGDLVASANSTLRGAVVTLTSNASVLLQDVAEITAT